eukprot:GEMP01011165.1.p1 GENE.GEMP01011165.1~~GEMP01011165.1.p1  ORF type:complete len:689 (+),score=98.25 GEMP01011165.1:243-2309(+)
MFYSPVNANERMYLECDSFALVAVAADDPWLWGTPIICAAFQILLLAVLVDQDEFIFLNGKISTEFTCNQLLHSHLKQQVIIGRSHLILSWISWGLQYLMTICFMFTALQMILAETTASKTVIKALALWMVVDFDNYLARYVVEAFDVRLSWAHINAKRAPKRPIEYAIFYIIPGVIYWATLIFCMQEKILPLSYLRYGKVTNEDPPRMLAGDLQMPEACCPPIVSFDGTYANISSLVMAKTAKGSQGFAGNAPLVYYALLEEGQPRPSSLQVIECSDGGGNPALQCGLVEAERSYDTAGWLQAANYSMAVYDTLLHGGLRLYESYIPYKVEWNKLALRIKPATIGLLFLVAKNPEFGSLSPIPVISRPLVSKHCAPNCLDCTNSGPGGCDRCVLGSTNVTWTHQLPGDVCTLCPPHCAECYFHNQCSKCLAGFWPKFGDNDVVACQPCGKNCKSCRSEKRCEECDVGLGLTETNTCAPCLEFCQCSKAAACDTCVTGYGLNGLGKCVPCLDHCKDCNMADRCKANNCEPGYTEINGLCLKCGPFCIKCLDAGRGLCDPDGCEEKTGYAPTMRACKRCTHSECLACSFEGSEKCLKCKPGLGLSSEGANLCAECGIGCKICVRAGYCQTCLPTYGVTRDGHCKHCADQCKNCTIAGPGRCDDCLPRYEVKNGVCERASKKDHVTPIYQ